MKTRVTLEPFQIVRARRIRRAKLYRLSLGLALGAVLFLGLGGLMGCAAPQPAPLELGGQVEPPFGFTALCLREPAECGGGTDAPRLAAMSPTAWAELAAVNAHVNALPQFADGDGDFWRAAGNAGGDCEDIVLEKRRRLIALGWPAEALLIAVVREWNGEGHAVMLVLSDAGRFVLDNKSPTIDRAGDVPYLWVKLQSPRRPYVWLAASAGGGTAPVYPPQDEPAPFLAALQEAAR
ncbi:MAG: transglutaminase-like cysteine peptidase [Parvibaculum sp.]|uniref:transglutaminase-like cysteine peptidase n=1 Tax=Parvibaculum sp. TaxID=2024848 RepID=UPI002ABCF032|nr:transglutaminase-like cysteine peptidase [Parvibaculum sp.]MDZ4382839.1 transglutaminase-like cysteine peptidase [Parvibaculum sp.]